MSKIDRQVTDALLPASQTILYRPRPSHTEPDHHIQSQTITYRPSDHLRPTRPQQWRSAATATDGDIITGNHPASDGRRRRRRRQRRRLARGRPWRHPWLVVARANKGLHQPRAPPAEGSINFELRWFGSVGSRLSRFIALPLRGRESDRQTLPARRALPAHGSFS